MKFSLLQQSFSKHVTPCLVIFIPLNKFGDELTSLGRALDLICDGLLSGLVEQNHLNAQYKHIDVLFSPNGLACQSLMLVGVGDPSKLDQTKIRQLIKCVISSLG